MRHTIRATYWANQNRSHNIYIEHSPISFILVSFLCSFRSPPNHAPLKWRCPYYRCVRFSHIHLSLVGLIEDIICSFQCGQMGQTSLNKSQYRLYLKCQSDFSYTSLFLIFPHCPPYWYVGFFHHKLGMCFIPPNLVPKDLVAMPCTNYSKVKSIS